MIEAIVLRLDTGKLIKLQIHNIIFTALIRFILFLFALKDNIKFVIANRLKVSIFYA